MRENVLVIDPDKLAAEGLSPIAAGKAAARMARLFLQEGVSFARESTLTSQFDFTLMEEAKRRGYEVELVYIRLASVALALERVAARVARGGHNVPPQDVVRRFSRSLENLPKAVSLADKVTILDNSSGNYTKSE
nr:zeta toxin family protein [uncultured Desulfovibrio sp.]